MKIKVFKNNLEVKKAVTLFKQVYAEYPFKEKWSNDLVYIFWLIKFLIKDFVPKFSGRDWGINPQIICIIRSLFNLTNSCKVVYFGQ